MNCGVPEWWKVWALVGEKTSFIFISSLWEKNHCQRALGDTANGDLLSSTLDEGDEFWSECVMCKFTSLLSSVSWMQVLFWIHKWQRCQLVPQPSVGPVCQWVHNILPSPALPASLPAWAQDMFWPPCEKTFPCFSESVVLSQCWCFQGGKAIGCLCDQSWGGEIPSNCDFKKWLCCLGEFHELKMGLALGTKVCPCCWILSCGLLRGCVCCYHWGFVSKG